jgi:hypothetical protein
MITRWCLLIGALIWAAPVHAQVIWSEDFEVPVGELHDGVGAPIIALKAKGWAGYIEASPTEEIGSIVSKIGRTGATTKVLRFRYGLMNHLPLATDNKNAKLTRFFTGVTELWTRTWFRWETLDPAQPSYWVKWPTMVSSKQLYTNPGLGETIGPSSGFLNSWAPNEMINATSTYFNRLCRTGHTVPQQTCNHLPNMTRVPLTLHQSVTDRPTEWTCVEEHFKFNSPLGAYNGIVELYMNGTLTMRYTDILMAIDPPSGSHSNTFRYVQRYRQSAENMFRYEDDIVYSRQRVGCTGGGGGTSDSTPPGPVQNFQVN